MEKLKSSKKLVNNLQIFVVKNNTNFLKMHHSANVGKDLLKFIII